MKMFLAAMLAVCCTFGVAFAEPKTKYVMGPDGVVRAIKYEDAVVLAKVDVDEVVATKSEVPVEIADTLPKPPPISAMPIPELKTVKRTVKKCFIGPDGKPFCVDVTEDVPVQSASSSIKWATPTGVPMESTVTPCATCGASASAGVMASSSCCSCAGCSGASGAIFPRLSNALASRPHPVRDFFKKVFGR